MPLADAYDGIIIGAGHNGLIVQAYLARAGLSTLTIERSLHAGGGLYTVEDNAHPGFYHNVHAVFLRAVTAMPWYRDLDLEGTGLRLVEPEVNLALHGEDGRCFVMHREAERTAQSLARFSRRDADTFLRLRDRYAPVVEAVIGPDQAAPPLPEAEKRALLERSEPGRRYLEAAALSPWEFLRRHFESPQVQSLLLAICVLREVDVRVPGMGFVPAQLIGASRKAQLAVGGSRELARAIERRVYGAGGDILLNRTPRRIVVEGGVARGVELEDGGFVAARRFVASSLNPQQTFLDLVGAGHLPDGLGARIERYRYGIVGPLFGVHLALDEAPDYRAAAFDPDAARAFMSVLGLDRPEQILDLHARLSAGDLPSKIWMNSATPTVHDPSQAPPGKHTAFVWQKVPYALRHGGGPAWDRLKAQHLEAVLARWREYAPNLTDAAIVNRFAFAPYDTERHLPNMAGGDLNVGWFDAAQIGSGRPLPELSGYRTPVERLYLCGACTHPGGNITGLPGYNAAGTIAADLGVRWWQPPDPRARWAALV
ncbi:MAG TPA: NAD(P)/FAD-dependent oxidoreductase [Chloroflexota bacterium]|nr:NAD(P)/FAD-dependent oxidoreductase [Chloroflexota bacterium]